MNADALACHNNLQVVVPYLLEHGSANSNTRRVATMDALLARSIIIIPIIIIMSSPSKFHNYVAVTGRKRTLFHCKIKVG